MIYIFAYVYIFTYVNIGAVTFVVFPGVISERRRDDMI